MAINFPDDTGGAQLADADLFFVADASDSNNAKEVSAQNIAGYLFPTTQAETDALVLITDFRYPSGDVRRYGAVGDGATDDSGAFQSAFNQAHEGGAPIFSNGTYFIETPLALASDGEDNIVWNCNTTYLKRDTDDTSPLLTVGLIQNNNIPFRLKMFGQVQLQYTGATTPATNAIGVQLHNVYESDLYFGAEGFNIGINIVPDDFDGFVYNSVKVGFIKNNNFGIRLYPGTTGWVNENTFYGGRFQSGGTKTLTHFIYCERSGGTYSRPNNNVFFRPSLEGGASETIDSLYKDDGYYNAIVWPRLEYSGTLNDAKIHLGPYCEGGTVHGLIYAQLSPNVTSSVKNEGISTTLIAAGEFIMTGGANGENDTPFNFQRSRAGSNPLPAMRVGDLYEQSGTLGSQVLELISGRSLAGTSYLVNARSNGDYVHTGVLYTAGANDRYQWYECIQGNTNVEPGVTAGWEDYWRPLHITDTIAPPGSSLWSNVTAYVAGVTQFRIDGDGKMRTNQTAAGTSLGSVTDKMEIFDENGNSVGFIPIYDAIT